ncbi:hypothetical protein Micbo1qcDRAFT_173595 [Microdochium bolleyi]|uniref:Uncharacterized protein n=1 Tax=Microdochium bolleyi TaxID=196109 RepID=A0A136JCJ5_9PEZI|nr:hypothetical protein Micbo1qcDRAFT_173595 [Microdochium bolleyi]
MERPMFGYGQVPLPEHGGTLTPLSGQLKQGLLATAILGGISVASTAWLFLYLTWRIARWKLTPKQSPSPPAAEDSLNVDLSLGLSEQHYRQYIQSTQANRANRGPPLRRLSSGTVNTTKTTVVTGVTVELPVDKHSNPVITLIYHLLLADVQQSAAFVIGAYWLQYDGIFVPSIPCYAQGWLLGLAKLAAAGFLSIISLNTYLTLVWGYKPPRKLMYWVITFNWIFSFACTLGGVLGTKTGLAKGGYYTRAGAWCWINPRYEVLRLWLEYFWIFLAMALTIVLHGLVFWSLWRNNHSPRYLPRQAACQRSLATLTSSSNTSCCAEEAVSGADEASRPSGHHPAFLLYPLIYIICVAPVAIARCIDMSLGAGTVSPGYYLVAGCLLACHGWMNVLLWTTTVIFVNEGYAKDTGLDRFAFMRTPHERRFGNMIWVQGGSNNVQAAGDSVHRSRLRAARTRLGHWTQQLRPSVLSRHGQAHRSFRNSLIPSGYVGPSSASQESLQHSARGGQSSVSNSNSSPATRAAAPAETSGGIQMEVVTTIVVEREDDADFSIGAVGGPMGEFFLGYTPPHPLEYPTRSMHASSLHKASLEGLHEWRP